MIAVYITTVNIKNIKQFPTYMIGFSNDYQNNLDLLKKMVAEIKIFDWNNITGTDIFLSLQEVLVLKGIVEEYLFKEFAKRTTHFMRYDRALKIGEDTIAYFNMRDEKDKFVVGFYSFWQMIIFAIEKERPFYITEIDVDYLMSNYTYNPELDS